MTTPQVPQQSTLTHRQPLARAVEVSKTYGHSPVAVQALHNVSVDFFRGEFTAIMGPSGSGKSTLMHCLAGLDSPTDGLVSLDGHTVSHMTERELTRFRRNHIGFIFQSFNLLPTLTARQNITLPLQLARQKIDPEWFDHVVRTVGLVDRMDHLPSQLSGGQQQRVACARALVARPSIVFADEPTGNLDSASANDVLTFMQHSVHDEGQTIVMVTHEPQAAAFADRVVFLADGRVVSELRNPTTTTVLDHMARLHPHSETSKATP